jgi:predicted metal-binding protein
MKKIVFIQCYGCIDEEIRLIKKIKALQKLKNVKYFSTCKVFFNV